MAKKITLTEQLLDAAEQITVDIFGKEYAVDRSARATIKYLERIRELEEAAVEKLGDADGKKSDAQDAIDAINMRYSVAEATVKCYLSEEAYTEICGVYKDRTGADPSFQFLEKLSNAITEIATTGEYEVPEGATEAEKAENKVAQFPENKASE